MQKNRKQWSLIALVAVCLLAFWLIGLSVSRAGKIKVKISASPADSKITIDGKKSGGGTAYVSPGEHTFSISRPPFDNASQKANISSGKNDQSIILIAPATSTQAKLWLNAHPKDYTERQALASKDANSTGAAAQAANPFISRLPLTNYVLGESYSIDLGPPPAGSTQPMIYVSASSPSLRASALAYIKVAGYNPANMNIVFTNVTTGFGRGNN